MTDPIGKTGGANRDVVSAPPPEISTAEIHVARKISPMTRIPPRTGTTARANGERRRGGRTGEPGTLCGVAVSMLPIVAAGWDHSTGST